MVTQGKTMGIMPMLEVYILFRDEPPYGVLSTYLVAFGSPDFRVRGQ